MTAAAKPAIERVMLVVPFELRIPVEAVEHLMLSALEGSPPGIRYWSSDVRVRKPYAISGKASMPFIQFAAKNLAAGGVLQILEEDDDVSRWHTLSLRGIKRGIALWCVRGLARFQEPDADGTASIDTSSSSADEIIQLAVFGELRYS